MKTIAVIGTGYVGLTTGACFSDMGNHVTCVDVDAEKIDKLNEGILPIHEPGLGEVVVRNLRAGRLHFTTSYADGMRDAQYIFIAVGTPDDGTGRADLGQVRAAARSVAEHLDHPIVVINKSTVPIGTGDLVTSIINEYRQDSVPFSVVSNPEFLREGAALADCMHPERVVLGATDREAAEEVARLYLSLQCPIIITDLRTAEMIKYASNAFLATRLSFINEVASICEQLGADIQQVALGMGYDSRIGPKFLEAGLGFGGSCFPKDVKALIQMAQDAGQHPQMLEAVMDINQDRRRWVVKTLQDRLGELRGTCITLLGIAFKAETDDVREAPALDIAEGLRAAGARVVAYDPAAMETAAESSTAMEFAPDAYAAAAGADAVVLVTDWNEFKALDLTMLREAMRGRLLLDGRNIYTPSVAVAAGFEYVGVARGHQNDLAALISPEQRTSVHS